MIEKIIETSAFLRSLNFLRVRHPYAARYNVFYPFALGVAVTVATVLFSKPSDLFSNDGAIERVLPLLNVIAPFYIAALAAVATFNGPAFLDRPFEMTGPVTLRIIGTRGAWEVIEVTPRHFLSLLFGYCTAVSLFLIGLSVFADSLGPVLLDFLPKAGDYILLAFVFLYSFFCAQLLFFTLLGVYYLADKAHRKDE